ncbi:MAG: TOMM precursor leader peptide-binding protein [Nitrospiraceae bacterium]
MHRLKALPVHLVQIQGGVVIKRGCTETKILGDGASEVVQTVFAATLTEAGATHSEILKLFSSPSRAAIEDLLHQLKDRRLLIEAIPESESTRQETPLDIFYWQSGHRTQIVEGHLNRHHFVICGVNHISSRIVSGLSASGAHNVTVLDHPQLRSGDLFDQAGRLLSDRWPMSIVAPLAFPGNLMKLPFDCLIAAAEYGSMGFLQDLNGMCVKEKRHFYPVVLQNMVGYVGPLIIPGESACFECFRSRQNSHMEDPISHRIFEESSFEAQDVVGFHPSMVSVIGDITALELVKFYGHLTSKNVGRLLELNLFDTRFTTRRVLKVPRCKVCSPLNRRPTVSMNKTGFVSLNTLNR